MKYLYRGVSLEMHQKNGGQIVPKACGPFTYSFHWDEYDWTSGVTWDESETNAVIRHQLRQEGFPTSGVSTTPHFERAKYYATHNGKDGVIYKIDRDILAYHGVKEFPVAGFATSPSIPDDEEVILVASNDEALPSEIVIEIIYERS